MFPAVSDGAGADGDGTGACETGEKSHGDDHGHVGADAAEDGEDEEEEVADIVDYHSTVEFGERCDDERTESVAGRVSAGLKRG